MSSKLKTRVEFKPKGAFKNNHLQTIYSALFHLPVELDSTEIINIPVDDKNIVQFEYNRYFLNSRTESCAIMVHGLGSSSRSNYITSTAKKLLENKIDVIRINFGCDYSDSGYFNYFYHAGFTEKLKILIDYCINELGYKKLTISGFSLGANMVLKLGGEYGSEYPKELAGACVVSPPFDLLECSKEIIKTKNKIYNDYYLKRLVKLAKDKKEHLLEKIEESHFSLINNLYDFDNYVVAPYFDFKDAEDYYSQNSSLKFINDIKLKTLVIQAKDDPIIPFGSTLKAQSYSNPNIDFLITEHGGHVGFLNSREASKNDVDINWSENRVVDFVKSV